MRPTLARWWQFLQDFPRVYVGLALALETLVLAVISRRFEMKEPLIQFLLGAREIVATGHIASTFLPIGYPALLGWAQVAGASFGPRGVALAVLSLHIAIALLGIVFARGVLLESMPARAATTVALLIGLNPRVIGNVFSVSDTNLSLVLLLALLACVLRLRRAGALRDAALTGITLGCCVLVRPNLLPMALLAVWAARGRPLRRVAEIAFTTAGAGLLTYMGAAALVHGRPFYPHNGPYNFYAGYNRYTETALLQHLNAEESIVPAMAAAGIRAELDWHRQPDIPGTADCRDQGYEAFYSRAAESYIREHPEEVVRLSVLKAWTLFRVPGVLEGPSARSRMLLGMLKTGSFLIAIPLWLGLLAYSKLNSRHLGNNAVIWMAVLYIAPFVLTNADPRFRVALEGVVLTDSARMLYLLYKSRPSEEKLSGRE